MRKKRQVPPSAQFAGAPIAPISPAYTGTTFAPEMAQPKYYVSEKNAWKTVVSDNIPEPV